MFIRWIMPALLVIAMLAGIMTGLEMDGPQLDPYYNDAALSLEQEHHQAEQLLQEVLQADSRYASLISSAEDAVKQLNVIEAAVRELSQAADEESHHDAQQKDAVDSIVAESEAHARDAEDVLDAVLATMLGKPVGQTFGKHANIKVFSLQEGGYRGYMAKVKLKDPKAVKLVLAGDTVGHEGETTSAAAKRMNAALAINAGGFARKDGLLYPMGITVVDGEIKTFYSTELSFIGINKDGNLVGGEVTSREQIEELNVQHGATFVPTLLENGKKQTIPDKWKNRKEPRTLIGHFSNGDLLLIVIDGRQQSSEGVTLEEAQDKLLEWNVRDAYNLDGGGSSTFVYDGKVLNSPSDGRERKVVSNFVVIP